MVTNSDIDELTFGPDRLPLEYLDFFEISGGEGVREVMLSIFRSELGSSLQTREPTTSEVDDIRSVVGKMISLATKTDAGLPDDYFVEFVDGVEQDFATIPPSRRVVFGLEKKLWKTQDIVRIGVG